MRKRHAEAEPPRHTTCHAQATFDFSLAEGVFVKASIKKVEYVNLWLGASVMLEYNLDEAKTLLVCMGSS